MRVLLLVLKFGLLAIIYLFIIRVFYFILTDLRRVPSRAVGRPDGRPAVGAGAELVVIESNDPSVRQGEVIHLTGKTRIGRGGSNNVIVTDNFVSHDHAQIIFRQENFYLEDLDSVNGTYINGVRVNEAMPLAHGDTIRIAGVTFKFVRWNYEVE
ncbi:MAG: FHA domain-containing protein [Firmicutes bacterium]|nr:FHA domain-containing protein [Bacillota bacterium]